MLRAAIQAKVLGKAMVVVAKIPRFGRVDPSTQRQHDARPAATTFATCRRKAWWRASYPR